MAPRWTPVVWLCAPRWRKRLTGSRHMSASSGALSWKRAERFLTKGRQQCRWSPKANQAIGAPQRLPPLLFYPWVSAGASIWWSKYKFNLLRAGLVIQRPRTVGGPDLSGIGTKLWKRIKFDIKLQIQGKTWHKILNEVTSVTKSQIEGKKWNSLLFLFLERVYIYDAYTHTLWMYARIGPLYLLHASLLIFSLANVFEVFIADRDEKSSWTVPKSRKAVHYS